VDIVEFGDNLAIGVVRRRAGGGEVAIAIFEVLRKLLGEIGFGWGREMKSGQAPADEIFPIRHVRFP
jgi:hypothetical protein